VIKEVLKAEHVRCKVCINEFQKESRLIVVGNNDVVLADWH
jgi:hypothetical protein